jgi:general secretion pathway protein E
MQRADASSIREIASRHGMTTLREDGARKVAAGITAASEVLRVTSEDLDG